MGYADSWPVVSPGGIQRPAQIIQSQRFEQESVERHKLLTLGLGGAHGQKEGAPPRVFHSPDAVGQLASGNAGHLEIDQEHIRPACRIGCE
jgi:hypothetical protein